MQIIDAHHHLWERGRFSYGWLEGAGALDRDFSWREYAELCRVAGVVKSVFVQADVDPVHALQECRWALSLAEGEGPLAGVVGWAPIERDDLEDYLERLRPHPKLKGVRRLIQGEADDFCARGDFVRGVRSLGARGLSFDLCLYHPQLPAAVELARAVPEVPMVLDHIGKPDIRHGALDPWRRDLRALASCPNVFCKLSGMVTEADPNAWDPMQLRPYFDHAVECFGFDRLLFGSDWPVSTLGVEYGGWVDAVRAALAGARAEDLEKVFYGNAAGFYRLGD